MDITNLDSSQNSTEWNSAVENARVFSFWASMVMFLIITIDSILTLVYVICIRRRSDWMFITFPALVLLYAGGAMGFLVSKYFGFELEHWMKVCLVYLNTVPLTLAYWLFAFQYL